MRGAGPPGLGSAGRRPAPPLDGERGERDFGASSAETHVEDLFEGGSARASERRRPPPPPPAAAAAGYRILGSPGGRRQRPTRFGPRLGSRRGGATAALQRRACAPEGWDFQGTQARGDVLACQPRGLEQAAARTVSRVRKLAYLNSPNRGLERRGSFRPSGLARNHVSPCVRAPTVPTLGDTGCWAGGPTSIRGRAPRPHALAYLTLHSSKSPARSGAALWQSVGERESER